MNISQPIASHIGSVGFGFHSSEDVKALSVKKIVNSTTFDTLLHPVPGGLYDAALGAWADNNCATCSLNTYSCPGHIGHIELPVPVYHVTYLDQLLLLLRGKCEFCGHLKLNPGEINRFTCQLRLVHHGLLIEAQQLDEIGPASKSHRSQLTGCGEDIEEGEEDDDESDPDALQRERNEFVRRAIKKANRKNCEDTGAAVKLEAVYEERRAIVKDLYAAIRKTKICALCKGCVRS
ncbi:MAG: hypothetical protein Q9183_006527 [Haloplaca sp. 2 TL-2023]